MQSAKKSFLSGVALLTASAAAVKLIGVFYKIPLVQLIGIEGMAYFLAAYHIYTLLFMLSTAGLPIAVSILVSKRRASGDESGAEEVFSASLKLFSLIGILCTAVMYFSADMIAASIKIPEAAFSIKAIAPSLFFVAASSAVRGYFQGSGAMAPTAVSQVIESVGKLVFGLAFSELAIYFGMPLESVAACAILGITAGSVLSSVYLFLLKSKRSPAKRKTRSKNTETLLEIIRIAAPITLGAAVISLTGVVDTALVSSRLQLAGFSSSLANSMYSSYGNLAIPLFNLVPSFIAPIAVAIAPMLAQASEKGDEQKARGLIASAIRLCSLIAIPACFGLAVFGEPILSLLYPSQTEAIKIAAPLLSVLSPAVLFSCMITVTNAILQAYRREGLTVISTVVGVAFKTALEYSLLSVSEINIFGAPISTLFCNLSIVCLNLYFVEKNSCGGIYRSVFLMSRPLVAALPATLGAMLTFFAVSSLGIGYSAATLAAIGADVVIYVLTASWNGSVGEDDLALLPKGEKIIKIMKKIRLLRNDNEQGRKNNFIEG